MALLAGAKRIKPPVVGTNRRSKAARESLQKDEKNSWRQKIFLSGMVSHSLGIVLVVVLQKENGRTIRVFDDRMEVLLSLLSSFENKMSDHCGNGVVR
ncbi:hypothetical protein JTE90_014472 [Oedothorax gibbosus]|uniref:Uncharacterized protein n=1 Tax=Oedothorax gibbosus TaxID=931172 RepID=A0AAV6VMF5_9ARAC|nr:hypothetical protein JTE90_014472 [Oedothorax gibbosus]